jgi:hypothetical protein
MFFYRLGPMVMIEASEAPLLSPYEAFKPHEPSNPLVSQAD